MKPWVKDPAFAALRVLAFLGTTNLACSGPPQGAATWLGEPSAPGKEQPPLDPFRPGASVVCDSSENPDGAGPDIFVLSAINHKLRHFPDFAAEIGMDSATDCESARTFMARYVEYFAAYPEFDTNEPMGPMSDAAGEPPPDDPPRAPAESQKIWFGDPVVNNPVVKIEFTAAVNGDPAWGVQDGLPFFNQGSPRVEQCTGTFINKNWILTAAHCLSFSSINRCLIDNVTKASCNPTWEHWGFWKITGTRGPAEVPYEIDVWARGYIQPNWLGRNKATNPAFCLPNSSTCHLASVGSRHDLALLYIRTSDDDSLEPVLEENGAKRISIENPPQMNWDMSYYGWGPNPLEISSPGERLRTDDPNLLLDFTRDDKVITGTVPNPPGNRSFPCHGDSGGPLMRTGLSMTTNGNRPRTDLEAIIGITSSISVPNTTNPPPFDCATSINLPAGAFVRWTRVDVEEHLQFIDDTLERYAFMSKFTCAKRQLTGMGAPPNVPPASVEECWGPPCSNANECGMNEQCWQPGSIYRTRNFCEACRDQGGTGCGCIKGQCFPK